MDNSTVLLLIDRETPDETIARFAEASLTDNTHLSCLMIGLAPEMPMAGFGIAPYGALNVPEEWVERLEAERQQEGERLREVEQILAGVSAAGDVQSAFCVQNEIKHHAERSARLSDIAYVAPSPRDNSGMREAASGVLFGSPIGLVLNCDAPIQPKTVFIAWDGSKAASRAVHAALPMLKAAKEVVIGCFDPLATPAADGSNPGSGLAAWLSHHGCHVTLNQYPSGGREIGECIQDRAREAGADLVVMGAYGHARILQAVFGGTSRTMMDQTEMPVFFAH